MQNESFKALMSREIRPEVGLSPKAISFLDSRQLSLFLLQRVNWLEDSLRVVIRQLILPKTRPSEYFRLKYSESLPMKERLTDNNDERRTLRFRLRYLLRCMSVISDRWEEFQQWHFTGLEGTLDIFVEVVRQRIGAERCKALCDVVERFSRVWHPVNSSVASEEDVKRELQSLTDDFDAVLEGIGVAFAAMERKEDERSRRLDEASELHRRSVVACEKLAAVRDMDDVDYSRLAGLKHLRGPKRRQVLDCIDYSHAHLAVLRPTAGEKVGPTLHHLAEVVWKAHAQEYAAMAKLGDAGYKSVSSLSAKLYKLAAKYPEADHFRWKQ